MGKMTEQFISSVHIEKLGHKLLEIRERALFNIISKLDNGLVFDNDLARSKEILSKLFQWFLFEPCTNEEQVFELLRRILKSESGRLLIRHYGKNVVKEELHKIRSYIEPPFYSNIDQLLSLIDEQTNVIVPPLECDIPLSYRTNDTNVCSPTVGTTATALEGFLIKDSSLEQQTGVEVVTSTLDSCSVSNDRTGENQRCRGYLASSVLQWQPLIDTDRHVLHSVENSLLKPPQPSALLHSCEFFNNVLLHDFPAEIFLQRPTIILQFHKLIETCASTRVRNAVFNCLQNLTKALQVRINHYNDPCMCNSKLDLLDQINSTCTTPTSENRNSLFEENFWSVSERFETPENVAFLKNNQITLQKFCCQSVRCVIKYLCARHESMREGAAKINQAGINNSLILLEELLLLLCSTVTKEIWEQKQDATSLEILKDLNELFVEFGDVLEYYRLESSTLDNDLNYRGIYLCLLQNCTVQLKKLVPINRTKLILPKNLKSSLCDTLLDVTLGRLYPNIYDAILEYVESFSVDGGIDLLKKYKDVKKVCAGMSATVKFLKKHESVSAADSILWAKAALASLEFHGNLAFVQAYTDICANKLPLLADHKKLMATAEDVTLRLLSHNLAEIQEQMYRWCHKIVISSVGPTTNPSTSTVQAGDQILFLLSSKVLMEICMYGMTNSNLQVQRYADDILIHVLKCKILVSDSVWNAVVEALISVLPLLVCLANKKSSLGRTIINMLDPDVAKTMCLPDIVVVKCNIELLFVDEAVLREEAFSRLCWLLATQPNSREMLPRLNNLYDKALANVCVHQTPVDVNKVRHSQHFYQPSSLHQIIDVLKSSNVEPIIRRSALTQISVMMEDPLLHQVFLDCNGLTVVTDIITVALTEKNFRDYPDSVVPVVAILKQICLYHSTVREELSTNVDVFYCILRGLFMFFAEERIKQDATVLLFLLIFKDYIVGSPSKADCSLPYFVCDKLRLPFTCQSHLKYSLYTGENLKVLLTADRWCLISLQIQWNCDNFGGLHELIKRNSVEYDKTGVITTPDLLQLNDYGLQALKASSIDFCIDKYLSCIQNGTSHDAVIDSIDKLTLYIHLYKISKNVGGNDGMDLNSYPWESSLSRFLKTLPSCADDVTLLRNVMKFLTFLVPCYKNSGKTCWITSMLKDPTYCLLDLLDTANTNDEEAKILNQDLLALIAICVCQEQHYLDYYTPFSVETKSSWSHIVRIIADNLKFSDAQHFYNLAYLDSLLLCLVHLTASLGWSNSKMGLSPREPIPQMIVGLCELVSAFHCGKGPSAAVSMMGLSITRHVLLILNHLLAELQNAKVKGWEVCFLDDVEEGGVFKSFLALWSSRDVILRAAALQLFAGLATSPRAALEIVNGFKEYSGGVFDLAMSILADDAEASIVRENAAMLLANLTAHTAVNPHKPLNDIQRDEALQLFNLVERYAFYNRLVIMLNSLFVMNIHLRNVCDYSLQYHRKVSASEKSWSSRSDGSEFCGSITTAGLVKAVATFLCNLLALDQEKVSGKLQEHGLIKLFFRTLCNPAMSVDNTKELSLYCDVLEMNTMVCYFLCKVCLCNAICFGTVLHTRDCLNVFLSLLNPKIYRKHNF